MTNAHNWMMRAQISRWDACRFRGPGTLAWPVARVLSRGMGPVSCTPTRRIGPLPSIGQFAVDEPCGELAWGTHSVIDNSGINV